MSITLPPYTLSSVTVESVERLTPHMQRITIDGSCIEGFRLGLPAQWLKVFVPMPNGSLSGGRAYTVRNFDPISRKLVLDFVLHGDNGPDSAWAERAGVGDTFKISSVHPRSGFAIKHATQRYLLFGDETALPSISGILETLPGHAQADVFVEISDAGEEQIFTTQATVNVRWLHRNDVALPCSTQLERAAKTIARPDLETAIWVAGESSAVKSIREHALSIWGVDRKLLHAAGYWKRGEADHRDEEG